MGHSEHLDTHNCIHMKEVSLFDDYIPDLCTEIIGYSEAKSNFNK